MFTVTVIDLNLIAIRRHVGTLGNACVDQRQMCATSNVSGLKSFPVDMVSLTHSLLRLKVLKFLIL